tara:strand:- start:346 stop:483 length:138 start_codon:yes stop_codon:yes gene_type:complete
MAFKKLNHHCSFDFTDCAAELKKYVFIDLRKQIRQKVEGVSASQF